MHFSIVIYDIFLYNSTLTEVMRSPNALVVLAIIFININKKQLHGNSINFAVSTTTAAARAVVKGCKN